MSEGFTRLTDITRLRQLYLRPNEARPGYLDCPKAIRDAFYGRPPQPKRWFTRALSLKLLLWSFVPLAYYFYGLYLLVLPKMSCLQRDALCIGCVVAVLAYTYWNERKVDHEDYGQKKALFDAFSSNPDLYRDEIFKSAVTKLPEMDFYGLHVPMDEAKIGKYERQLLEGLRKLGIQQEFKVANRGRPFAIHQYELKELRRGRWENGDSKNYVLDIAVLWPERRIKYNIEVDDPSHNEPLRRQKDIRRDAQLTERGWFVRRMNHNFFELGYADEALKEIVGVVYFFAKYADDKRLGWEERLAAIVQNRRFRRSLEASRDSEQVAKTASDKLPEVG